MMSGSFLSYCSSFVEEICMLARRIAYMYVNTHALSPGECSFLTFGELLILSFVL